MLTSTFCHIPGIGPKYESRLWSLGFEDWDAVLRGNGGPTPRMSPKRFALISRHLEESVNQLRERNAGFFAERMPPEEHWRLFPEFSGSVAYLDIESTGTRANIDAVTTISVYDGRNVRCYVRGRNLDEFPRDIAGFDLLVTYNGKCFDVPFLENTFDIRIQAAHIDLRYLLASLGYRGGLKGCERQMGIDRGNLEGVDGYFAILLWYDYERNGNERALETLLAYNVADTVNLEHLMVTAYNEKIKATPFGKREYRVTSRPTLPFRADPETIRRLREGFSTG